VLGSDKIKIIEPQTIQLYKHIDFSQRVALNNNDICVLLFFGVYNEYIDEADEEQLFSQCEIKGLDLLAKGILSGLVDGFIIYKSNNETLLKDISKILNKLFTKNKTGNKSFFDRVFPISVFTLSTKMVNDSNIEILKMVKTNYK